MKIITFFSQRQRGQAASEYLIFLGMVVALTLTAFANSIPKITADYDGDSTQQMPYAVKYFSNVATKINEGSYVEPPGN